MWPVHLLIIFLFLFWMFVFLATLYLPLCFILANYYNKVHANMHFSLVSSQEPHSKALFNMLKNIINTPPLAASMDNYGNSLYS